MNPSEESESAERNISPICFLSYQPPWSIHCLSSSMGGCAPYVSNMGMFRSSMKKIKCFPIGGPNTPLRLRDTGTIVNMAGKWIEIRLATGVFFFLPFVQLAVDAVLSLVGRGSGGEHEEVRDEFGRHFLQQLVRNGQGLSCTGRSDTQELKDATATTLRKQEKDKKVCFVLCACTEALTGFLLVRSLSMRKDILIVSAVGTMMSA